MKSVKIIGIAIFGFIATAMASDRVVINEIMYNSPGADVEFVELYNITDSEIDLTGWYILDDNDSHAPCFLSGTLGPGEYLVVVGDHTQFGANYPGVAKVNPNAFDTNGTGWSLGNTGDTVRLFDGSGTLHDIVGYDSGVEWPARPNGNGPSLELLHPSLDNTKASSWDPSNVDKGTPGAQNSVYTENVVPICKDGQRNIDLPSSSTDVVITVIAVDIESLTKVELFVDVGGGYVVQIMYDNGLNGDITPGDSVFSSIIPAQPTGTLVKYYAVATDAVGQTDSWPNNAPISYHAYTIGYQPPNIRITEALPKNDSGIRDEAGERDDWFEIYNADDVAVNLSGLFVSDDLESRTNFVLPAVFINPGEYMIVWADGEVGQGPLHTDFKLSAVGEAVAIFETVHHGNVLIDGWQFGRTGSDVSVGLISLEDTAPEYLSSPTPGASNESSTLFSPICINEFLSTSAFGGIDDWIEIFNRGDSPFDLSGCFLSDSRQNSTKWRFPNGTILDPGQYLVIYEDALNFGLSAKGGEVLMLTAPDSTTGLDFYDFGPQQPDVSHGRYPDGASRWAFMRTPTPGQANSSQSGTIDELIDIPSKFTLFQNHPNPFNPETTIAFNLPGSQQAVVKIYDALGREIITLLNRRLSPGRHRVLWNGIDGSGRQVSSGVYFYRVEAGELMSFGKMVLLR